MKIDMKNLSKEDQKVIKQAIKEFFIGNKWYFYVFISLWVLAFGINFSQIFVKVFVFNDIFSAVNYGVICIFLALVLANEIQKRKISVMLKFLLPVNETLKKMVENANGQIRVLEQIKKEKEDKIEELENKIKELGDMVDELSGVDLNS